MGTISLLLAFLSQGCDKGNVERPPPELVVCLGVSTGFWWRRDGLDYAGCTYDVEHWIVPTQGPERVAVTFFTSSLRTPDRPEHALLFLQRVVETNGYLGRPDVLCVTTDYYPLGGDAYRGLLDVASNTTELVRVRPETYLTRQLQHSQLPRNRALAMAKEHLDAIGVPMRELRHWVAARDELGFAWSVHACGDDTYYGPRAIVVVGDDGCLKFQVVSLAVETATDGKQAP